MENRDNKIELWKDAIPRMNEEDLEFLLDFSECFDSKLVKMAKTRYKQLTKPQDDDDEETNMAVVKSIASEVFDILEELGCPGKYDEDRDIAFTYKDSNFYITTYEDAPEFIDIWEYSWKRVNLNNADEVTKVHHAINSVNWIGEISACYTFNDSNEMCIHFGTRTFFLAHIPNSGKFLKYLLERFFDTHHFFEDKIQMLYEKEQSGKIAS